MLALKGTKGQREIEFVSGKGANVCTHSCEYKPKHQRARISPKKGEISSVGKESAQLLVEPTALSLSESRVEKGR